MFCETTRGQILRPQNSHHAAQTIIKIRVPTFFSAGANFFSLLETGSVVTHNVNGFHAASCEKKNPG